MKTNSDFFEADNYYIDQNAIPLKLCQCYQIFNDKREGIGLIKQKFTKTQKVLGIFFGRGILPFMFEIRSASGGLEASVSRGWIFLLSKIIIRDSSGKKVGSITYDFSFYKATYKVFNASNQVIAEISGNWKEWNFVINVTPDNGADSLNNKWYGEIKKLFKSATKYNVNVENDCKNKEDKIAILTSAITFGMVQ